MTRKDPIIITSEYLCVKKNSVAFVSITLFDMLQSPIMLVPDAISAFTEAYVSLRRISTYLKDPEVQLPTRDDIFSISGQPRIGFENSIFEWPNNKNVEKSSMSEHIIPDERTPLLPNDNNDLCNKYLSNSETDKSYDDVSYVSQQQRFIPFQLRIPSAFDFPSNQLSLVYGSTGSGKSSLLHALLGEMDTLKGKAYLPLNGFPHNNDTTASTQQLHVNEQACFDEEGQTFYSGAIAAAFSNSVAYAAQQPFLLQATIRDNILFGQPYEADRYQKVLWQCALVKDLSILPHGDQTEIGEKGISLSGGQKQR